MAVVTEDTMEQALDPEAAAEAAGLRYVEDDEPGISRRRRGQGFSYHRPDGEMVSDADRARIEELAIPPAWRDVWICTSDDGHVQATGRDDEDRKQYRYHDRWREARDRIKFERMGDFATSLPAIRSAVDCDLRRPDLDEPRALALAIRLLDLTLIRVGNGEYYEQNGSVGLTTMRREHVEVSGERITFCFPGKSGKELEIELVDARSARAVGRCLELPGELVFQFAGDEGPVPVTSERINRHLQEIAGPTTTAKDFRTWGASAEVVARLGPDEPADTERERQRLVLDAIDAAAARLGNTRAVCRSGYCHPGVVEAYEEGLLAEAWRRARRRKRPEALPPEEHVLDTLLDIM